MSTPSRVPHASALPAFDIPKKSARLASDGSKATLYRRSSWGSQPIEGGPLLVTPVGFADGT